MKNGILEGFSLALLIQLNTYRIIKGEKDVFREKKRTQLKHTNTPQNTNILHAFLQIIYGGTGCSAQTSYKDLIASVHKSKMLPRSLILM